MRTKEKLAAVGEMAAQLAHEIRNPLGSIRGSAQVLMGEPELGEEQGRLLSIISRESKRLSDTLNRFLYQARSPARPHDPVDLRPVVEEAVTLLRNGAEVGPNHEVRFEADEGPHVCLADPDQIAQVFWNLARNGLEAMPDGGRLEVTLRRVASDVVLTVSDQGRGMGRDEQRRLFEPRPGSARPGSRPRPRHRLPDRPPARGRHHRPQRGRPGDAVRRAPAPRPAARRRMRRVARAARSRPPRSRPPSLATFARGARALARLLPARHPRLLVPAHEPPSAARSPRARWPLWNPWVGFGAPLLADASFQLAYPPTWLALLLRPAVQFKVADDRPRLLAALGALRARAAARPGWTAAGSGAGPPTRSRGRSSPRRACPPLRGRGVAPLAALRARGARAAAGPGGGAAARARRGGPAPGRLGRPVPRRGAPRRRPPGLAPRARPAARPAGPRPRGERRALAAALALALGAAQWLPTAERARAGLPRGAGPPHEHLLVAPPGLARRPGGAAARVRPARSSAAARGRRSSRAASPSCRASTSASSPLALGALGLALRPRARGRAGRGGPRAPASCRLGRHTPLYGLLLGLPGFGLHALPAEVPLAGGALPGLPGGGRGRRPGGARWSAAERRRARASWRALLARGRRRAASRPRGGSTGPRTASPRSSPGRRPARGARRPLGHAEARPQRRSSPCCWRSSPGGAPRGSGPDRAATAALLGLGAAGPRGRGPRREPARAPRAPGPPARRWWTGSGEDETRLHAAVEGPGCLAPGTGPPGWEPRWIAALGFQDTLRPPSGARWGLGAATTASSPAWARRWTAPFTAAAWTRLGTPGGLRLLQIGGVSHVLRVGTSPVPGLEPARDPPVPLRVPAAGAAASPTRCPAPTSCAASAAAPTRRRPFAVAPRPRLRPEARGRAGRRAGRPLPPASGPDEVRVVSRRARRAGARGALAAPGVLVVLEAFDPGWRADGGRRAERRSCAPTASSAPCGSARDGTASASPTGRGRRAVGRGARRVARPRRRRDGARPAGARGAARARRGVAGPAPRG